jgi:hypothetical protein
LILQLPLSVWWWCFRDTSAFGKVSEAGEAAPYDGRPWWRIGGAIEIAPEPRDRPDIKIQITRTLLYSFRRRAIKQVLFGFSEGHL